MINNTQKIIKYIKDIIYRTFSLSKDSVSDKGWKIGAQERFIFEVLATRWFFVVGKESQTSISFVINNFTTTIMPKKKALY